MRRFVVLFVLAIGLGAACQEAPSVFYDAEHVPVRAVSYNMANATGAQATAIAEHITALAPDFVSAQECGGGCDEILDALPGEFEMSDEAFAGVTILYDASKWQLCDEGSVRLGDNDDGWGPRVAEWGLFSNIETFQRVQVYSTHWCVTVRSDEDRCDSSRQLRYAEEILFDISHRRNLETPVVVAGDLNVFDGFEDGVVIEDLLASGLTDVYRVRNPLADGTTFRGNSFAPPGRIDYILATSPVSVLDAAIDRERAPSDHFAVTATLQFPD